MATGSGQMSSPEDISALVPDTTGAGSAGPSAAAAHATAVPAPVAAPHRNPVPAPAPRVRPPFVQPNPGPRNADGNQTIQQIPADGTPVAPTEEGTSQMTWQKLLVIAACVLVGALTLLSLGERYGIIEPVNQPPPRRYVEYPLYYQPAPYRQPYFAPLVRSSPGAIPVVPGTERYTGGTCPRSDGSIGRAGLDPYGNRVCYRY
jgi:hypothetical protein